MMKERFDTKADFAGKEYWPTMVGTVVEWKTETGATHEILCTSAMVAWVFWRGGVSKRVSPEYRAAFVNQQLTLFPFQGL